MILEPNGTPADVYKAPRGASGSYVEWSAVFGGTVLASAISLVMVQFGSAIGLATTSPYDTARELTTGGLLAIGIWMLWVQVTASMCGGYIAGRMRAPVNAMHDHEREVRDGVHGALVWATGTVFVALVLTLAAGFATMHTAPATEPVTISENATPHRNHLRLLDGGDLADFRCSSLVGGNNGWRTPR